MANELRVGDRLDSRNVVVILLKYGDHGRLWNPILLALGGTLDELVGELPL